MKQKECEHQWEVFERWISDSKKLWIKRTNLWFIKRCKKCGSLSRDMIEMPADSEMFVLKGEKSND